MKINSVDKVAIYLLLLSKIEVTINIRVELKTLAYEKKEKKIKIVA
jgi:hypothetical protein